MTKPTKCQSSLEQEKHSYKHISWFQNVFKTLIIKTVTWIGIKTDIKSNGIEWRRWKLVYTCQSLEWTPSRSSVVTVASTVSEKLGYLCMAGKRLGPYLRHMKTNNVLEDFKSLHGTVKLPEGSRRKVSWHWFGKKFLDVILKTGNRGKTRKW